MARASRLPVAQVIYIYLGMLECSLNSSSTAITMERLRILSRKTDKESRGGFWLALADEDVPPRIDQQLHILLPNGAVPVSDLPMAMKSSANAVTTNTTSQKRNSYIFPRVRKDTMSDSRSGERL